MSVIGNFVQQSKGFRAFVPSPFPSEKIINWSNDLICLLSQADQSIGHLNAIDQLVPDVDFFIFMYVKKEATFSSQIEGTQATFIDVIRAEAKLSDGGPSDVDEIRNYISAMNYGIERLKTFPLSLRLIREIHEKLLRGVRGQHKTPGEFRTSQNWIGGPSIETATFIPPPTHELTRCLSDLEKFMHTKALPILIKTGLIHAQFETIHPFLDGNGRIGRLLTTFYLYKEGALLRPLLYLSSFFKRHRQNYYDRLNNYRSGGVEDWLKFFLEGIRTVSLEAVDTAKKITSLREKHVELVSGFGRNANTALVLLNKLYTFPIVDTQLVSKLTKLSKVPTLSLISKFVSGGILHEVTGKERNRQFVYKDYLKQFSDEKVK